MRGTEFSWFDVPERLADQFDDVAALRLPGHKPFKLAVTMDSYLNKIEEIADGEDDLILIGHSMGGAVITHFAAKFPDRVKRLIYVAAMLPKAGDTIGGLSLSFGVDDDAIEEEFEKAGIDDDDPALGAQPPLPLLAALPDEPKVADLPKHYVLCKDDLIIPAPHQTLMIANWDDVEVIELDSGHFPQKKATDALMTALEGFISG